MTFRRGLGNERPQGSVYLHITYTVRLNGMPLMVVARNLGHVDTRTVEKHYGHLAPSFIVEAIRISAPRYGIANDGSVVGKPT
jgi:hypothetical protein